MKILIIDDDTTALAASQNILEQSPLVSTVETVANMDEFFACIQTELPDAVMIDVEMGSISGFEVASYLQRQYPQIPYIFLTGHTEWALKGYEYSPLDFLSKPLSPFRLDQTLQKIKVYTEKKTDKLSANRKIGFMVNQGYVFLPVREILYLERVQRKVCIHRINGATITVNDTLKNLSCILGDSKFFRCHQSFLVALDYIEGICAEDGGSVFFLQLRNCSDTIPLSRKAYPELKQQLEARGINFC